MPARKSLKTNALIFLIIFIAIVVVVNILSLNLFWRLDLTKNKVNSLSEASIKAVQDLDDLEVKVYISPDLPEEIELDNGQKLDLKGLKTKFLDKLREYQSYSNGNMKIFIVKDNVEEKAKKAKLELITGRTHFRKGAISAAQYALGATFEYKNVIERMKTALRPDFYEYEITKILVRLKEKAKKTLEQQDIQDAGDDIFKAISECHDLFKKATETKEKKQGIQALFMTKEESEAQLLNLKANLSKIKSVCDKAIAKIDSYKNLIGKNDYFDLFIDSTKDFKKVYKIFLDTIKSGDESSKIKAVKAANFLVEAFDDIDKAHDELKNSPGRMSVGFICGHGEFCPFPSNKRIINPTLAQLMQQKNPMFANIIEQAKQLENSINMINDNINRAFFKEKGILIKKIDLTKPIPPDVMSLVIYGPTEPIPQKEWYYIDQFLLKGKTVIVFLKNFDTKIYAMNDKQETVVNSIEATPTNIADYLKNYGIKVNKDLMYDPKMNATMNIIIMQKQGQFNIQTQKMINYPAFIVTRNLDRTNPLVKNLQSLVLPFVSSLEIDESAPGAKGIEFLPIIKSEPTTVAWKTGIVVDPAKLQDSFYAKYGTDPFVPGKEYILAMIAKGEFTSYFKGKKLPLDEKTENKDKEKLKKELLKEKKDFVEKGKGKLLVLGTNFGLDGLNPEDIFKGVDISKMANGDFSFINAIRKAYTRFMNWRLALTQKIPFLKENLLFIENVFDWSVQKEALAEIRSKTYTENNLAYISETTKNIITYGIIIFIPVLFIIFGIVRWYYKKNYIAKKVKMLISKMEGSK